MQTHTKTSLASHTHKKTHKTATASSIISSSKESLEEMIKKTHYAEFKKKEKKTT